MVRRGGFGLVEVIVAMTLIAIGIMSIAAGAAFSSRLLRIAENGEDAARIAEVLIDSIAYSGTGGAGSADIERFHAQWTAAGSGVRLDMTLRDSPDISPLSFVVDIPPRLDTLPCSDCDE